jgi:hypothetical protein
VKSLAHLGSIIYNVPGKMWPIYLDRLPKITHQVGMRDPEPTKKTGENSAHLLHLHLVCDSADACCIAPQQGRNDIVL